MRFKSPWLIMLPLLIASAALAEQSSEIIVEQHVDAYWKREIEVRESLGQAPQKVYQQAIVEAKALVAKHRPESYGYHPITDPEQIPPTLKKLGVRGIKVWSDGQCNLILNGAFDAETGYVVLEEDGKWSIKSYIVEQDEANHTVKDIAVEEQ